MYDYFYHTIFYRIFQVVFIYGYRAFFAKIIRNLKMFTANNIVNTQQSKYYKNPAERSVNGTSCGVY